MTGPTRAADAVAALRDVVSPVAVARAVMEKTPHVMLTGSGALAFARHSDFELVEDPASWYKLPVGVMREELAGAAPTGRLALWHSTSRARWLPRHRQAAPSANSKRASVSSETDIEVATFA